jgi:hypothetical protein
MKILARSGLLLVAFASVVSAAPSKDETAERVSYTAETPSKKSPTNPEGKWVELASPTPASHGRVFITVDGRYAQLRVEAAKGRPAIRTVRIIYASGKDRVVRIGRTLSGKKKTAVVDLSGAPIDHIIVEANARSKGSYTVTGVPVSTGVATRQD